LRIREFGALVAALLLVGCNGGGGDTAQGTTGGGTGTPNSGKQLKVGLVFDSGGRGDKSFNDSAYAGLERAQKELGSEIKSIDSKSEKDYETNLTALADQGYDVVIAVGLGQQNALQTVAPKYPDIKFAIVDSVVEQPNVRSLVFSEEQGSFLAGYAAALASKTGKIGFVGGQSIPLIKKFEVGYTAGAKSANPNIQILPAKYTESWDDVSRGKASAKLLFDSGADVVYHAAGRCGLGVIDAAEDAGKFAIGVDSNQDGVKPGRVLTSMIKRVDEAVFQTISDIQNGKFEAGKKSYDLAAKGVGLTDFQYTKDVIGAENLKKLEDISKRIVAGEIVVPSTEADLANFKAPTA